MKKFIINSILIKFVYFVFLSVNKIFFNSFISNQTFNVSAENLSKKSNLKFILNLKILKQFSIFKFNSFIDICVVDNLKRFKKLLLNRFYVYYLLISVFFNIRVLFCTNWNFGMNLHTLLNLFEGSNWAEREAFDMFGILFSDHLDLRRILNDYGFEGFPNQKNFPIYGFKELIYNEEINAVIYTNLSLVQNYRNFFTINVWG